MSVTGAPTLWKSSTFVVVVVVQFAVAVLSAVGGGRDCAVQATHKCVRIVTYERYTYAFVRDLLLRTCGQYDSSSSSSRFKYTP